MKELGEEVVVKLELGGLGHAGRDGHKPTAHFFGQSSAFGQQLTRILQQTFVYKLTIIIFLKFQQ